MFNSVGTVVWIVLQIACLSCCYCDGQSVRSDKEGLLSEVEDLTVNDVDEDGTTPFWYPM